MSTNLTSWLSTTTPYTLQTPIPASVSRTALLRALHDPHITIASSPFILDFTRLVPDTPAAIPPKPPDTASKSALHHPPPPMSEVPQSKAPSGQTIAEMFLPYFAFLDEGLASDGGESTGSEGEVEAEAEYYAIDEKVPYYPSFTFRAALRKQTDGFDAVVFAPLGLVIMATWRVVDKTGGILRDQKGKRRAGRGGAEGVGFEGGEGTEGDMEEGEGAQMLVLEERASLSANVLLMPFVRAQYDKGHRKVHADVVRAALEGRGEGA